MGNTPVVPPPSEFSLSVVHLAEEGRNEELKDLIDAMNKLIKTSAKTDTPYTREDYWRDLNANDYEAFEAAASNGHAEALKILKASGSIYPSKALLRRVSLIAAKNNFKEVLKVLADYPYAVFGPGHGSVLEDPEKDKKLRQEVIKTAERYGHRSLVEYLFSLRFLLVSITRKRGIIDDPTFREGEFEVLNVVFDPSQHHLETFDDADGGRGGRKRTKTESTSFSSKTRKPPVLDGFDFKSSTCFDMFTDFDSVRVTDYLQQDPDNVVIVYAPEMDESKTRRSSRGEAICYTKTLLRQFFENPEYGLAECVGPEGDEGQIISSPEDIGRNPPIFVKFVALGFNAYIPRSNMKRAVESSQQIFCLVPLLNAETQVQAVLSHTIAEGILTEDPEDPVPGNPNNCQAGTSVSLYKFVKCGILGKD